MVEGTLDTCITLRTLNYGKYGMLLIMDNAKDLYHQPYVRHSELGRMTSTWRPRRLSKWFISRVISALNGVTLITTLLITDLLSPLGLQEGPSRF